MAAGGAPGSAGAPPVGGRTAPRVTTAGEGDGVLLGAGARTRVGRSAGRVGGRHRVSGPVACRGWADRGVLRSACRCGLARWRAGPEPVPFGGGAPGWTGPPAR